MPGQVTDDLPCDPTYLLRGHGTKGPLLATWTGPLVSVVSTLRDVADEFQSWLEWFRIAGFAHLFLYFDDPAKDDASIKDALSTYSASFLSIVIRNADLEAEWPSLKSWKQFASYTDDRMCRQLLNIAHCIRRVTRAPCGSAEAVDWLLHLDHDEVFLPPYCGLQEHFRRLDAGGCRLCLYENYEAVPEDHTLTPFLDVSLFKVPSGRMPRTPAGAKAMNFWSERTQAGTYFLYYDNGKSAVRLRHKISGTKASEFAPSSVHVLFAEEELGELMESGAAWTTFPEREVQELNIGWMVVQTEESIAGARVLHYPATHYDRLFRKYDHLKDFPAIRFGGSLVVPPSFHLEARDCYLQSQDAGAEVQKLQLKELLNKAAMLSDLAQVSEQLHSGSVVRIEAVGKSLKLGRWLPPARLCEGFAERLRRRPSLEGIDRIRMMPRVDVELLFAATGGLLKQLEPGLDDIARRLETSGWAACALGGHPGMLAKALCEAESLQGRMAPGTTVIQNRIVDQSLPNAQRGDLILWLEEQSLSGPGAAQGPASTLALLERAMTDIGMKLDVRLQRSSLGLRITERCDGMLAVYDGGGAAYGPHVDNADGDGRVDGRILTAVLYLNPRWDRVQGGALAIFETEAGDLGDSDVTGRWNQVWPEAGTLVFFRAEKMLHEVMPSHARRFALSMWFCGRRVES